MKASLVKLVLVVSLCSFACTEKVQLDNTLRIDPALDASTIEATLEAAQMWQDVTKGMVRIHTVMNATRDQDDWSIRSLELNYGELGRTWQGQIAIDTAQLDQIEADIASGMPITDPAVRKRAILHEMGHALVFRKPWFPQQHEDHGLMNAYIYDELTCIDQFTLDLFCSVVPGCSAGSGLVSNCPTE